MILALDSENDLFHILIQKIRFSEMQFFYSGKKVLTTGFIKELLSYLLRTNLRVMDNFENTFKDLLNVCNGRDNEQNT